MIKFAFRWAFRLLIVAIVLVIGLLLLKDTIAKNLAEQRIRRETGFDAKIGKLEVGLLSPKINIENFVLYNPAEFGGSPFLSVPDLHIEYNPDELAFRRLRLLDLRGANAFTYSSSDDGCAERLRTRACHILG